MKERLNPARRLVCCLQCCYRREYRTAMAAKQHWRDHEKQTGHRRTVLLEVERVT